jgi:hypothetical protein
MIRKGCNPWMVLSHTQRLPQVLLALASFLLLFEDTSVIFVKSTANHLLLLVSPTSKIKDQLIVKTYRYSYPISSVQDTGQAASIMRRFTVLMTRREPQRSPFYLAHRCDDEDNAPAAAGFISDEKKIGLDEETRGDSIISTSSHCSSLYETLHNVLKQAIESNRRRHRSLTLEYEKVQQADQLHHRADLLIANLYQFKANGVQSIKVQDWDNEEVTLSINTSSYNSAQEEAQDLYQIARKMKRGSMIVQQLIRESAQKQNELETLLNGLECLHKDFLFGEAKEAAQDQAIVMQQLKKVKERITFFSKKYDLKIMPFFQVSNKQQSEGISWNVRNNSSNKQQQQHACRKFRSPCGLVVLVGRNKRENEYISFHAARGKDVWLHARGCSGAHVLLQVRRGDPVPTEEDIQFAANLAAYYSNVRTERKAVITTAEPKHIQKPRGAPPGTVKIRQELGSVIGYPMDVADELKKETYSSSGGRFSISDDYEWGALGDKAKNRKRSLQLEKEKQAKKRAQRRERQPPRARRVQNEFTAVDDADDIK